MWAIAAGDLEAFQRLGGVLFFILGGAMDVQTAQENLINDGYINANGFVTVEKNAPHIPGEGNGLLQTGLWYVIKAQEGAFTQVDRDTVSLLTEACRQADTQFLYRSPYEKNSDDNQEHDDYWGWLAACYFAKSAYPFWFYQSAQIYKWFIDIQRPLFPRPQYFFARFLGFVPFVKMTCRGSDLGKRWITSIQVWDHFQMALVIVLACFSIDQSDKCIRDYCRITVARKESWLCALIAPFWFKRIRKKYGITGMAFQGYFKTASHPLCMGDWR